MRAKQPFSIMHNFLVMPEIQSKVDVIMSNHIQPEGAGVLCFVITAGFWTAQPDSFVLNVLVGFQVALRVHLVTTNITFILHLQMPDLDVVSQSIHSRCFIFTLWAGNS